MIPEAKKLYVCPAPECHTMSLASPFLMVPMHHPRMTYPHLTPECRNTFIEPTPSLSVNGQSAGNASDPRRSWSYTPPSTGPIG